jgi:ABC-2 type transport system ATP-binding protein
LLLPQNPGSDSRNKPTGQPCDQKHDTSTILVILFAQQYTIFGNIFVKYCLSVSLPLWENESNPEWKTRVRIMLLAENLTGGYQKAKPVIHDLSFAVKPGEWVGLIGANGAGKSTTIKHILGLLQPFSGTISIDGKTLAEDVRFYRSRFAYIPEVPQFYEELTLWEHMELTAKAYAVPHEVFVKKAEALLDMFAMKHARDWFPGTFSKGMQQKIMILCAFLPEVRYLIVDEPFIGLDPLAVRTLTDLLREKKKKGCGIFMSTHILDLAEKYCDRFILLHKGKILLDGTMEEMRQKTDMPGASLEKIFFHTVRGEAG